MAELNNQMWAVFLLISQSNYMIQISKFLHWFSFFNALLLNLKEDFEALFSSLNLWISFIKAKIFDNIDYSAHLPHWFHDFRNSKNNRNQKNRKQEVSWSTLLETHNTVKKCLINALTCLLSVAFILDYCSAHSIDI